jgi:hypothetical protein
MNLHTLEALMSDIEAEDPLDLGDLAIDEHEARRLMAGHFCDIDRQLADHGLDAEARLEVMAAIAAHTMTENLLLHLARLRAHAGDKHVGHNRSPAAADDEFRTWMRRHGLGG